MNCQNSGAFKIFQETRRKPLQCQTTPVFLYRQIDYFTNQHKRIMAIFGLFKTEKDDPKQQPTFVGQTNANDLRKVSEITKKVTGESPTHVTGGMGIKTGHTSKHTVDFIDKEDLGGIPPDKFMGGSIPL